MKELIEIYVRTINYRCMQNRYQITLQCIPQNCFSFYDFQIIEEQSIREMVSLYIIITLSSHSIYFIEPVFSTDETRTMQYQQ